MFSFRQRFATLGDTIKKYPITTTILCAVCALSLVSIWQYKRGLESDQLDLLNKLLMISLVYIFASAAVTKRFSEHTIYHTVGQVVLFALIVCYFFITPSTLYDAPQSFFIRHVLIQITSIVSLLVLTLWTPKRNEQSMYHGVIQLFLHAVLAGLFSLVLAGGIMGALWGIEQLFGVTIVSEWYPTIFAVVGILFGGLSFLDGIRKWEIDEDEPIESVKWKTLLGRVVGFLLLLYGVILYIYLGKIIITGKRPSNEVTPLSFAFSGLVVLGSILLVPLVTDERNIVLRKKVLIWMYGALLPILVMVFFAIKLRIDQYGVTEMRYLLCALLVWLLLSAGYMMISKHKDLRRVAAIFTILSIVSFVGGPLSASGVAKSCQEKKLETFILTHNVRGDDGLLSKAILISLTNDEQQELAGLLRYLIDYHGAATIDEYVTRNVGDDSYAILEKLGLPMYPAWDTYVDDYIYLGVEETLSGIEVIGYTTLYRNISLYYDTGNKTTTTNSSGVTASIEGSDVLLTFDGVSHTIDINTLVETFRTIALGDDGYNNIRIASNQFVFDGGSYKLFFTYINGRTTPEGIFSLEGAEFDLLVE